MVKKILNHTNNEDLNSLKKFISSNPKGCEKFRYYLNRDFSVLNNHIFTCLYYKDDELIGYGHLDEENGKIWLGIMVSDNKKSKGYGNLIIDDLLQQTNEPIYLSVDNDNEIAYHLYKKKNFNTLEENNKYKIMKKNGRYVR